MNEILLLNIKFFIIFNFCYLVIRIVIKYLFQNAFHRTRYFVMKLVPLISGCTIGVDYLSKKIAIYYPGIYTEAVDKITKDIKLGSTELYPAFMYCIKIFMMIWIIGIIVLLIKYGIEYFSFRRMHCNIESIPSTILNDKLLECERKLGVMGNVNICYSKNTEVPFTSGIIRPRIIIPVSMSDNLEPIILHERIHCINCDMLVKTAVEFLKIVQWFNPLMHLYTLDLADFCEIACDEQVSRLLTFEERKKYAQEILNSARVHKFSTCSTTFSTVQNYQKRLYYLLYQENGKKTHRVFLVLCIILTMSSGGMLIKGFNQSPVLDALSNVLSSEELMKKIIKVNYLHGEEKKDFYYEEYIDDFWWRGTLTAEGSKIISSKLVEVTFSGEIYKCNE